MTDEMIALGRRAVACRGFRWMPGMRTVRDDGHGFHIGCTVAASKIKPEWLPDLSDPATAGALLALVREAHGDPVLFARLRGARVRPDWMVSWNGSDVIATGATEAEALVAALESAP